MSAGMDATPPIEPPQRATRKATSLVLVNTGDGKGKSTAAFGTAMRASAAGWRVCVVQFVKSGAWRTGEQKASATLGIDWWTAGDGFTWDSAAMDETEALSREGWRTASSLLAAGDHRLIVLDEITYPMNWGWIPTKEVVDAIVARPVDVSVVATGRDAPAELIAIADTVTEMRNEKHAFDQGVRAMRGIDF
ncbi:MAG: cob(I)yrinic acid a,c-diamide adenosyltransferase [Actinomycetota bacterium]